MGMGMGTECAAPAAFTLPAPENKPAKGPAKWEAPHQTPTKGDGLTPAQSWPASSCFAAPGGVLQPQEPLPAEGSGNGAGFEPLPSTVFALFLYWLGPEAALQRAK